MAINEGEMAQFSVCTQILTNDVHLILSKQYLWKLKL